MRRTTTTSRGWLALATAALAGLLLLAGPGDTAARAQETAAPAPTEQIDVEQAVDFPYDI